MIEEDCTERLPVVIVILDWNIFFFFFFKCYFFREIRMKYFINIEILYEKFFFVISKYCPVSNSNVNTIVTDINNVESSTDSDSSNKVYNVNNNNNSNNVVYNSNLMFHKL